MTNAHHKVLYTGVTSGIEIRTVKHKTKYYKNSFTAQYNCDKLVFYRHLPSMTEAIAFEKKAQSRQPRKENSTNTRNESRVAGFV